MALLRSLPTLVLALLLLHQALAPALRTTRRWNHSTHALAALRARGQPEARLTRLSASLDALAEDPAPPSFLPALRAAAALRAGDAPAATTHLADFREADTPLARAVDRFLAGSSAAPPDAPGRSDPFALILVGWRLEHAGAREELEAVPERFPVRHRGDFHVRYLAFLARIHRRPRAVEAAREELERLYEALHQPPVVPDLGFTPDAFHPVVYAEIDASIGLDRGVWRGELVPAREGRLRRRADLHLALASLHHLAGDANRSLYHAQILEQSYLEDLDGRAARARLAPLLYPRPHRTEVLGIARRYDLDPSLLFAVAREESHFKADAISSAGARGLLQLMPDTARWIALQRGEPPPGARDLLEPAVNLDLGAWYLRHLADKFWRKETRFPWALAAYNAGLRPTTRWLEEWKRRRRAGEAVEVVDVIDFPETRGYVVKVTRAWNEYRQIYTSPGPARRR